MVVEGRADSGAQEHLYLETQGALALPGEGGSIKVISATQAPTAVQRIVARVLGLPMHQVEVEVLRLGGGFGGKEDQATPVGLPGRAGRLPPGPAGQAGAQAPGGHALDRQAPPLFLGFPARAPGTTADLLAYEVALYQNSGCTADLSTSILERTLFHATSSYLIPNVRATGACCRTNLPSNTAFRGFGGPQAMFVIEAAIGQLAAALGVEREEIQEKNLLSEGDVLPYGQRVRGAPGPPQLPAGPHPLPAGRAALGGGGVQPHHPLAKKGLALMPVCFGISFTNQR